MNNNELGKVYDKNVLGATIEYTIKCNGWPYIADYCTNNLEEAQKCVQMVNKNKLFLLNLRNRILEENDISKIKEHIYHKDYDYNMPEVLEEYLATIFLIKDYFETIYTEDLSKIKWAEYEGCKFCTKDEETGHIVRGYYPEPLPYWVYEYDSDISEQDVIDWFKGKKVSDDIKSDCEIYIGNGILCFEDMYFIMHEID